MFPEDFEPVLAAARFWFEILPVFPNCLLFLLQVTSSTGCVCAAVAANAPCPKAPRTASPSTMVSTSSSSLAACSPSLKYVPRNELPRVLRLWRNVFSVCAQC